MMEYLGNWKFWLAVIVVTFIAHWAFNMIGSKMGASA